jgi:hypothetical protein
VFQAEQRCQAPHVMMAIRIQLAMFTKLIVRVQVHWLTVWVFQAEQRYQVPHVMMAIQQRVTMFIRLTVHVRVI